MTCESCNGCGWDDGADDVCWLCNGTGWIDEPHDSEDPN